MCELDADSDLVLTSHEPQIVSFMQPYLCTNRVQTTASPLPTQVRNNSPLPTQVRNNVGAAVKACGFDSCSCCNSLALLTKK